MIVQHLFSPKPSHSPNCDTGALFTGGRYGSLGNLKVKDIDFRSRTALFRVTKSGKRQSVKLTAAACKFLRTEIAGKSADDYVFVKASGERWKASDQARRMADACAGAKIEPPVTFHELRDTFASHLVMAGVPILTVSKLLGHADVRVTEKHYAHLAPGYLQNAVDEHLPEATRMRIALSPWYKHGGLNIFRFPDFSLSRNA